MEGIRKVFLSEFVFALILIQTCEGVQRLRDIGMAIAQHQLAYGQRSQVQRLGFLVSALLSCVVVVNKIHQYNLNRTDKEPSLPVQYGQAVDGLCEVRILFIQDSLPDTQRALVCSCGLDKLACDPKQIP